jgi:hypothetical protein
LSGCGRRCDPGKARLNDVHTARIKGEESPLTYDGRDTRGDVLPAFRCGLGYGFGVIDARGLVRRRAHLQLYREYRGGRWRSERKTS